MKKSTKRKTTKKSSRGGSASGRKTKNFSKQAEMVKEKIHDAVDDVVGLALKAKKKYDKADAATKKKVITGIAGAGALIAGVIGLSAVKKRKK